MLLIYDPSLRNGCLDLLWKEVLVQSADGKIMCIDKLGDSMNLSHSKFRSH